MDASCWYSVGLRFACTRCGNCCRRPGTVRVEEDEVARLAARLGATSEAFRALYTRRVSGRARGDTRTLIAKPTGECVFYEVGRGCTVYEARPRQCRTYPFWSALVASEERWRQEAERCPGMGVGTLHSAAEVRGLAEDDGTLGPRRPS